MYEKIEMEEVKQSCKAENIKKGDFVLIKNKTYYPVEKTNKETVTVKNWLGVSEFQFNFPYSEIQEVKTSKNRSKKMKDYKYMNMKEINFVLSSLEDFKYQAIERQRRLSEDFKNGGICLKSYKNGKKEVKRDLNLCAQEIEILKSARATKTLRARVKDLSPIFSQNMRFMLKNWREILIEKVERL